MKYKSKKEAQEDHIQNYKSDGVLKQKGQPLASDFLRVKFILDNVPKEALVLDIGVNGGTIALPLTKLGCRVKGIDIVPELVKKAKERGVFAEIGEAEDLSRFADNTFDAIICSEVLEHLYDPLPAVQEAYRVLKPGGVYLVTVPHPRGFMATSAIGDYHQQDFSIKEIDALLHKSFKRGNVNISHIPYDPNYCHVNRLDKTIPQWMGLRATKESN